MGFLGDLFSFEGRVGRARFWITHAVLTVLTLVVGLCLYFLSTKGDTGHTVCAIGTAVGIFILIWVSLSVSFRRWHDMNYSGLMMALCLVPLVGSLVVTIWLGFGPGTKGRNTYGRPGVGSGTKREVVDFLPVGE